MTIQAAIETNYASLTPPQKKLARYIGEHYETVVFLPINQLAEQLTVSPASIVRFTKAIGYQGYSDMQQSLRSSVTVTKTQTETLTDASDSSQAAKECLQDMDQMFRNLDAAQLERVSSTMMTADNILVVGYMDSFSTAAELVHRFYGIRDHVHFSRLMNDWEQILNLMASETLVIAVSFAPHYQYTHTFVKTAKERGCSVLLFSDEKLNPLCDFADETILFKLSRTGQGTVHHQLDVSPVMAYIHQLFCYLAKQYPTASLDANRYNEKFLDEFH